MLEACAVRSAIITVRLVLVLVRITRRRAREACGDEPAEGVGPHRSCRERDAAVGEPVAESGDGVEGVVAELVFADGDVEELSRNVSGWCQLVGNDVKWVKSLPERSRLRYDGRGRREYRWIS